MFHALKSFNVKSGRLQNSMITLRNHLGYIMNGQTVICITYKHVVYSGHPISLYLPGQSGGGDLLPARARYEQLNEVQIDVTIRARATCHKENLRTDYRIGFTDIVWTFRFI